MKQSEFIEQTFVFVVDAHQQPLMPTTPARAAHWMKTRKATGFWKNGLFCVRLNQAPSGRISQPIAVGVDPGSKREGFTIKSKAHTYLNIQLSAIWWVMARLEKAAQMRGSRRGRTTPYRPCRLNRNQSKKAGWIPPSTFARWNLKLRILKWLARVIPITTVVVEDIQAGTRLRRKGKSRRSHAGWNKNFSPLQQGKKWFYVEIERQGWQLALRQGYQTKQLRDQLGLVKNHAKLDERFDVHCLDSWVLANDVVGGHQKPDNTRMMHVAPNPVIRRQLHKRQEAKGGLRKAVGGTSRTIKIKGERRTFVRGSLVNYVGRGLCLLGGYTGDWKYNQGTFTLNTLAGKEKYKLVKPYKIKFVAYHKWLIHFGTKVKQTVKQACPPIWTFTQIPLFADFQPTRAKNQKALAPSIALPG